MKYQLNQALAEALGAKLTPLFEHAGERAVEDGSAHVADQLASVLAEYATQLHDQIKDQHGKHGLKRALPQMETWALHVAESVLKQHLDDVMEQIRHAVHGTKLPTTR